MNLIAIVGICITTASFSLLLKQYKPEFSLTVSIIGTLFVFSVIIAEMIPLFSEVRILATKGNLSFEYVKIVLKALGISYITEIGTDVCKESGHLGLASKVELAGKVAILITALPMFNGLLEIASELIYL